MHHFGDRARLLTAVAAEGLQLLARELQDTDANTGTFLELGVASVQFAVQHRASFEVMFRPELYDSDDPVPQEARRAARALLFRPFAQVPAGSGNPQRAGLAAWSLAHGLATLLLSGNLPVELRRDPESLARSVAGYLFASPAEPASAPACSSRSAAARARVDRFVRGRCDVPVFAWPSPLLRCRPGERRGKSSASRAAW
jgi:AcrR family transcriptional regulator